MTGGRYTHGYGPYAGPTRVSGYYGPYRSPCAAGHCHHGSSLGSAMRNAAGIALTAYAVRSLTGYHDRGCRGCGRGMW